MSLPLPEKSNLIVIGAWNPAILQHSWLRNEFPALITEDNINIQLVAGAGSVSSYRMEFEKFFLDPNGGRLVFSPKKFELETLKLIADLAQGIREKLQFTPIAAAGCNFSYKLEQNEAFTLDTIEEEDQLKGLYDCFKSQCDLVARGVRHTFSGEDYRININYDYLGDGKILRINFDYQPPINPMKIAAERYVNNFSRAEEIKESLILRG